MKAFSKLKISRRCNLIILRFKIEGTAHGIKQFLPSTKSTKRYKEKGADDKA